MGLASHSAINAVADPLFASAELDPSAASRLASAACALDATSSTSPQDQIDVMMSSSSSSDTANQSSGTAAAATAAVAATEAIASISAYTTEIFQQTLGAALDYLPSSSLSEALNSAQQQVISSTKNYYEWLSSFADPRVESWPMMSSPLPTLCLFFLYLIVANYGPSLMKSRKPLQLRWLLVIYNLYVSLLNLWIALELCYCSYKLRYKSMCQLVLITRDPYVMRIANGVWWYYASKGIEFADTLFFILRKKDRQLTFLHKYHHSSMFIVWWTAARFVPGGSAIIPIVVNSLVHVLMYAYYGLSALGPQVQKYLWWKRYLTIIQLIQFFIGVSIGIHLITSNCQFTRWMQYVFSGYAFSFIILFGNFYLNEYIKGRQQQQQQQQRQRQPKQIVKQSDVPIAKQNGFDKIKQT